MCASASTVCMGQWCSTSIPLLAASSGGVGAQGLPTRTQLGEQWADVAAQTARLSKLPDGHGGLLSLAAAGLAARLKVHANPFLILLARGPISSYFCCLRMGSSGVQGAISTGAAADLIQYNTASM